MEIEDDKRMWTTRLNITIYTAQEKIPVIPDDMPTQFIMKGIDWNELQLVQKGINLK